MQSIRELFRTGNGPSSSHTMGPRKAAERFHQQHPQAARYQVKLYGSLAATGKGHLTDQAISQAFAPTPVSFDWLPEQELSLHPNGMCFEAVDGEGKLMASQVVYSIGGGALQEENQPAAQQNQAVYDLHSMKEILRFCTGNGCCFWEYVEMREGAEIWEFLRQGWFTMRSAIDRGTLAEGVLPGGLGLSRRAAAIYRKTKMTGPYYQRSGFLAAYSLAVAEENASGGIVVTAPTCGSAGVLPAVLRYMQEVIDCREDVVLRALATAGLIGCLVKHNASISGAEVGCQGEIGVACAMSAAAAAQMMGGTIRQVEYAAEMGLEHFLGLTCDPVGGLVQIPCIERNAFAAMRAVGSADFSMLSDGSHRVSFDNVVEVMKNTGHDLPSLYRETATGGLATKYRFPENQSGH